jgi:hypothetical protein
MDRLDGSAPNWPLKLQMSAQSVCHLILLYQSAFLSFLSSENALYVPTGHGNFLEQRRALSSDADFNIDVLPAIHQTIGCEDARIPPNLAYRLSSAPKKDNPIVLASEEDWQGLVDAVKVENANRKPNLRGIVPVDVKIIVPDEVSLLL